MKIELTDDEIYTLLGVLESRSASAKLQAYQGKRDKEATEKYCKKLCDLSSKLYYSKIKTEEQKLGKPKAFYTGGGIWICAMWIDKDHYIAVDNDWYADGFCIYEKDEDEDPEIEFSCTNMIGEKTMEEFDDTDRANYTKMKETLNGAMGE